MNPSPVLMPARCPDELPSMALGFTRHAMRRGKTRCGLCGDDLAEAVLRGPVIRREGGTYYVAVAGRRGQGLAIVTVQRRGLVVVTVIPGLGRRRQR